MTITIGIVILGIYFACPIIGKVVLLILNSVIHDPIPFVDEIIMWCGMIQNINRVINITDWIEVHPKLSKCIAVCVVFVLMIIASVIINYIF